MSVKRVLIICGILGLVAGGYFVYVMSIIGGELRELHEFEVQESLADD